MAQLICQKIIVIPIQFIPFVIIITYLVIIIIYSTSFNIKPCNARTFNQYIYIYIYIYLNAVGDVLKFVEKLETEFTINWILNMWLLFSLKANLRQLFKFRLLVPRFSRKKEKRKKRETANSRRRSNNYAKKE